jgi:diguanylate cyclase (GGDEF)-like protein/PAS domain S-box-containing protein
MRSNGLANLPAPGRESNSDLDTAIYEKGETNPSTEAAAARPFRERRRSRPIEEVRHEALDSVNRLLMRYEKIQEQLRESEEKYRSIFEDALVGMFQVSADGRPLNVNRTMARIYGYDTPEQLLADVSHVGKQVLVDPDQLIAWRSSIEEEGTASGIEVEIHCREGAKKWLSLNVRAVRDGRGRIGYYEGTAEDITARKGAEQQIQFLAYYDALTGLPNRTLFDVQLVDALAAARWREGKAALLLLELARFKIINDSLGHSFGDRLLQEIADRIKRGAGEHAVVARVGGDEFAILLANVEDASDAALIARRIVTELTGEFSFLGHSLNIACHIGISLFPENGIDALALRENADVALYSAREEGANKFRFFTEQMNVQILERLTLENGLGLALDRNELFLVYQPQVDMRTGTITGLEALLRWQHPQLGLVPPNSFIGIAENSGMIVPIGEWVLRTACAQARKWQDAGLPAVPVAVNVSAVQFRQQGFPELVRDVLKDTGLEPKYLELELTESLLLTNADVMFSILQELREMGVKLAIDDFGTGYSSLGYLRQFQVNRLKIDRSFVRDVAVNPDDAAITTAIIRMAKALNLEVLAEGVEDEAQLSFLRAQHCYEIQGYYFSKPVAVEQIVEQLRCASIQPAALALGQ